MTYLISYDIEIDKIRTKLAKVLEGYGVRVQYSVFECKLTEQRFYRLYREIFELVEGKTDGSVRFYTICKNCEEKIVTIGKPMNELSVLQSQVIVI